MREANALDATIFNAVFSAPVGATLAWGVFAALTLFPGADIITATVIYGLINIPVLIMMALLASSMPRTGGDYVWVSRILSPPLALISNFAAALSATIGATIRAKTVTPGAHRSFLRTIADGRDFVTREKPTRSIIGLIAVFSLFGIPYVTLLPVLAGEILGSGAAGLSSLVASGGAGAFLGALVIAFRGEIRRKRVFIPAAALVFSFGMLGLSFSGNLYLSMGLIFAASWGITSFLAAGNSFIQNAVPDALRGRVMSLYTFVFLGFAPLGNSLIGVIADACGTVFSLKILALVCIAGSVVFTGVFRKHGGDES